MSEAGIRTNVLTVDFGFGTERSRTPIQDARLNPFRNDALTSPRLNLSVNAFWNYRIVRPLFRSARSSRVMRLASIRELFIALAAIATGS